MPRNGITYDQVAAVADRMRAEDVNPTIKNVREHLGSGSMNTIQRHLAIWRDTQPQKSITSTDLPPNIIQTFSRELERVKSESRAEIEARLVLVQAEAAELAVIGETLEANQEHLVGEVNRLTTNRDMLLGQVHEQNNEIERLTREIQQERFTVEQARTELAQLRNKKDMQIDRLTELAATIEKLDLEKTAELQAKIVAEKEVAVLSAKFQAEQEKTKTLLLEKEQLVVQIDSERQSAEKSRIEAARIASELDLQCFALAEKTSANTEMMKFYETERNARIYAETRIAVMASKVEGQDIAKSHELGFYTLTK